MGANEFGPKLWRIRTRRRMEAFECVGACHLLDFYVAGNAHSRALGLVATSGNSKQQTLSSNMPSNIQILLTLYSAIGSSLVS